MPIYEFHCAHCNKILQFFARRAGVEKTPSCPHCGGSLVRNVEDFATISADGPSDKQKQEERVERVVDELLARTEQGADEDKMEAEFNQIVDSGTEFDHDPVDPTASRKTHIVPTLDPTLYDL